MFEYTDGSGINELVGRTIKRIFMNEDYLKFETDHGTLIYGVSADCCSDSVFYDFLGVKHLLNNGKIMTVEAISLNDKPEFEGDRGATKEQSDHDRKNYQDCIQVYGFRLTTMHPEFGEVSSVFSFRNYSNGYYGGSMQLQDPAPTEVIEPEIFDDVIETERNETHKQDYYMELSKERSK